MSSKHSNGLLCDAKGGILAKAYKVYAMGLPIPSTIYVQ